MCGSTPRLPTILTDAHPALCARRVPGDEALHSHLDVLQAARLSHTQAEADVSFRRALASNATNVTLQNLHMGDAVYYWTDGDILSQGAWQDPTHVADVAVEKTTVGLQHGNQWVNCHTSQLRSTDASTSFGAAPAVPADEVSDALPSLAMSTAPPLHPRARSVTRTPSTPQRMKRLWYLCCQAPPLPCNAMHATMWTNVRHPHRLQPTRLSGLAGRARHLSELT